MDEKVILVILKNIEKRIESIENSMMNRSEKELILTQLDYIIENINAIS